MKISKQAHEKLHKNFCSFLDGGKLELLDHRGVILATLRFGAPAFTFSEGKSTSVPLIDEERAIGGKAVKFKARSRDGMEIMEGTVGTHGADLNLDRDVIEDGARVSVKSFYVE